MSNQRLSHEESDALYERVKAGESAAQVARSIGKDVSGFYRLLERRYGHTFTGEWSLTVTIPDDIPTRAYLAGLVDGEGSIMFTVVGWQLKIGMTDKGVIDWLGTFGGSRTDRPPQKHANLPSYHWRVSRKLDLIAVLTAILPYMIVKKDIAVRALAELKGEANASL